MEFRDYAATETAALLGRLLSTQADGAAQQLRHLREALESAARAAEAAAAEAPAVVDQDVKALASKLGAAAAAELQRVEQDARATTDAVRTDLAGRQAALDAQEAENRTLAAALADARARSEGLREDLERETERADAADRDLDATIEAHKQVDAARIDAETAHRREAHARTALESELRDTHVLLDASRANASHLLEQLESEAARIAALAAERDGAAAERVALAARLASATADYDTVSLRAEAVTADFEQAIVQLEAARSDVEGTTSQLAAARAQCDALSDRVDTVSAQYEATVAQNETAALQLEMLTAQTEIAAAQVESLTARYEAAMAQIEVLTAREETATAQVEALEKENEAATARAEDATLRLEVVAAELEASRARVHGLEYDLTARNEAYRQLEGRLAESLRAEATVLENAAGRSNELDRAQAEMVAQAEDASRLTRLITASVGAVDALGQATNVSDLLAALVNQLSRAFPRVALFRVKGNHVEGEHQRGFDMTADVAKLVIPLNMDSIITRAASTGVAAQLTGIELAGSNHAPFGGTPSTAMALPIGFQDETLAVAYVESDTATEDAPDQAAEAIARLLVRHTVVLVTRLSQELKTLAELRDYACMLIQEADQMYGADVEAGKSEADRRRRLRETIDCARQLYAQRAALEGAAAATLLDEQIALQSEDSSGFARELAAVAGIEQQPHRKTAS